MKTKLDNKSCAKCQDIKNIEREKAAHYSKRGNSAHGVIECRIVDKTLYITRYDFSILFYS